MSHTPPSHSSPSPPPNHPDLDPQIHTLENQIAKATTRLLDRSPENDILARVRKEKIAELEWLRREKEIQGLEARIERATERLLTKGGWNDLLARVREEKIVELERLRGRRDGGR